MEMNGAQILIKAMEEQNVDVIFGYPGGAVLEIYDALLKSPIRHILVRHEQGAAHAASGYARASGKVGVCLATSGPGATNLVTGIATAYMDSIPMVIITGQVPRRMVGTDAFQEVDITGITSPITKHNYLVQNIKDIPKIVAEAFYIARTGRPGPVLIDLPRDVAMELSEYKSYSKVDIRGYKPTIYGHPSMIKKAVKEIKKSKRLLICVGGGVIHSQASAEVVQLAELTGAKVVSTLMGLGGFPGDHPQFCGMLGTYGQKAANEAVQECDCFLALGMRFGDRVVGDPERFAPHAEIIHIDIDPAEIGKNIRADLPIVGDIRNILRDILNEMHEEKEEMPQPALKWEPNEQMASDDEEPDCKAFRILKQMQAVMPEDAIVTTDVGQHQIWTAKYYTFRQPRTFISSGGLGAMGYGIPAALGAQVAMPERLVVTVTGDGSFQMGMPELGTIAELGLPIKIVLFNNQTLGMVRQLQYDYCGGRYAGVYFKKTIDFMHLAKAYGAESYRIEDEKEAAAIFKEAFSNKKLTLIECPIDRDELVRPIVLAGDHLGQMTD